MAVCVDGWIAGCWMAGRPDISSGRLMGEEASREGAPVRMAGLDAFSIVASVSWKVRVRPGSDGKSRWPGVPVRVRGRHPPVPSSHGRVSESRSAGGPGRPENPSFAASGCPWAGRRASCPPSTEAHPRVWPSWRRWGGRERAPYLSCKSLTHLQMRSPAHVALRLFVHPSPADGS